MNNSCFSYSLSEKNEYAALNPNNLLEEHLREILDLLIPMSGNKELQINGIKFLNQRHLIYPLCYSKEKHTETSSDHLDLYEPRIGYIRNILQSLLSLIDLESNGKPIKIDGFRLKNPDQWLSQGGGASDIIAHAASSCNLNCLFCYNKGTSDILKPVKRESKKEYDEIKSRIDHYIPQTRMNIFPDMKSPQEALIHPYISEILSGLRKKTDECFRISTNGSALTPETINMLAENRPVYLDISLNSSSPDRRAWLMGDKNPETVLNSFELLEKAGIPYSVVIVPWPFPAKETMINDLKQTIEFTYSKNPTLIQISLPGYTKNISDKFWFSTEDVWSAIKINVQSLRSRTGSPIALRPGLYEEYADVDKLNQPVLLGSVRNSPISNAGILPGDYILKINGIPVKSRCQARSLLTVLHQSDLKKSSLTVIRNKKQLDIEFDLLNFGYPYAKESATHLGAVFASSGIPEIWIENLKQTIDEYNAENVLLLTSTLVKPLLEKLIAKNGWFSSINLNLHTPENNYFNGNIFMGDLLTVEDFVFAVNKFMERNIRPDLVVLPSSPFYLSGCGRDLTGRVYLDIERSLNIPVALVECDPIFD